MARPMRKEKIIESMKTERKRLYRYFPKIAPEDLEQPGVVGEWSVRDLLAHLTAWEQIFLGWYEDGLQGKKVEVPAPGMKWSQLDELNDIIYKQHKHKSFKTVREEAKTSFEQMLKTVEGMTEEMLNEPGYYPWTGKYTLGYLLRECTDIHYRWAWKLVSKWMRAHPSYRPKKDEIIEQILTERRRLENNLAMLTPEQLVEPGVVGKWSIKDILAHLTAWERMFLGWYDAGKRGEIPETPAPGYTWGNYHILNEKIYLENKDRPLKEVQDEFETHYKYTLDRVRGIPEEEWFKTNLYAWMEDRVTIARYIRANTGNHYRWAKNQINKWLRGKG